MFTKKDFTKILSPIMRTSSPTGLETLLQCPRRRYLQKKFKLTSAEFAKGTHLHRKIEELRTNHLRCYLGKNSRYNSAKAFANIVANDWQRGPIKEGKIRGDKILWKDEKQPYYIKKQIKEICLRAYLILMEEAEKNPPIIFEKRSKNGNRKFKTAYEFEIIYKGRGFEGEIDEIRKEEDKIIIRDYKTGRWHFIEDKLEYAFQQTEYEFAVCSLLAGDGEVSEEFRKIMNISKEQANSWIKKPEELSEHIIFEYFMLDLPQKWNEEEKKFVTIENVNPIIKAPNKREFNYKELCQNIDIGHAITREIEDQKYYPPWRGRHCKW